MSPPIAGIISLKYHGILDRYSRFTSQELKNVASKNLIAYLNKIAP